MGEEFGYTLRVTNNGPSDAADVKITDVLPAFVEQGTDGRCAYDPKDAGNPNDNTVTCSPGSVGRDSTDNVVAVTIRVKAEQPGTQVNRATVESSTPDSNKGNNGSSDVTTSVNAVADLAITKTDNGPDGSDLPAVNVGEKLTYALTVENLGPSPAENVLVVDTLPENVTFEQDGTDPRCAYNENDPQRPGNRDVLPLSGRRPTRRGRASSITLGSPEAPRSLGRAILASSGPRTPRTTSIRSRRGSTRLRRIPR